MTVSHPPDLAIIAPRDAQRSRSGVLERLDEILEVFTDGDGPLRLDDVTRLTGLPRSTVFRLLNQMVSLSWLEQDAGGYRLGSRLTEFNQRTQDYGPLRSAASRVLNELHLTTGGVAHLAVLEGASMHYLDKVGGAVASSIPSRVGSRLPAASTACGRAVFASLAPERVDTLVSRTLFGADVHRLHMRLSQVRRRGGFAVEGASSCAMGIAVVAAPVRGPGGLVAAVSVATRRQTDGDDLVPLVTFAARRISAAANR